MQLQAEGQETSKAGIFDKLIEILLVCLFAIMPLSFGAVQAWSEYVVITAVSLIALLFCCKLIIYPQERIIRTWAYIPL
ncbi:MAG: hypothetical protein WC962_09040, partial [Phycisphaerae bacterium]